MGESHQKIAIFITILLGNPNLLGQIHCAIDNYAHFHPIIVRSMMQNDLFSIEL